MTNREQVGRWAALANEATPGPWEAVPHDDPESTILYGGDRRPMLWADGWEQSIDVTDADAAHIAAAREAVPAMAAMLIRMAVVLDAWKRWYESPAGDCPALDTALLLAEWNEEEMV